MPSSPAGGRRPGAEGDHAVHHGHAPPAPPRWPAARPTSWCSARRTRLPGRPRCGSPSTARPTSRCASRSSPRARQNPAFEVGFTSFDFDPPGRRAVRVQPAAGHQGHRVGHEPGPGAPGHQQAPGPGTAQATSPRSSAPAGPRSSSPPAAAAGAPAPARTPARSRRCSRLLPKVSRRLGLGPPARGHPVLRGAHRRRPASPSARSTPQTLYAALASVMTEVGRRHRPG